jgi:hypothetical protein
MGTQLVVALIAISFIVLLIKSRIAAIVAVFYYVVLLGDLRRIRDLIFPHPPLDLMILIPLIIAALLALPLLLKVRLHDPLSKAMFWLLIFMVIEVFNPLQGGITVGFGGALFYITPVLFFWIGREYGSPAVVEMIIYRVLLPLSLAAAVLGLCQNFYGFTPWEQAWIDLNRSTFTILSLGGSNGVRSFGFLVSPAEYMTLLMMGAAAATGAAFGRNKVWAFSLPFFVTALVLAGGRGAIVKLLFALAMLFAVRRSGRLGVGGLLRTLIFMIVGMGLVMMIASRFVSSGNSSGPQSANQAAIARQAAGLSNPLGEHTSTAGLHAQYVLMGIVAGFKMPIGYGLGMATAAAGKFGAGSMFTEVDLSDLFISLGCFGGILYLYTFFQVLKTAVGYLSKVPKEISLPMLGTLLCGIGSWLESGQYSTCDIWLFLIGALTYSIRAARNSERSPRPNAVALQR